MSAQSDNFSTEGGQGKLCNLEKLFSERNTDDGNAPEYADQEISEGHDDAEKDQPDDIGKGGRCPAAVDNFLAERTEGHAGKFEALPAIRDADDRDAPDNPCKPPGQTAQEPSEDEPQDVADCFHMGNPPDMEKVSFRWERDASV